MKTALFQLCSRVVLSSLLLLLVSCQKDDFYEKEFLDNPYSTEDGGVDGGDTGETTGGDSTGGSTGGATTGGATTGGATTGGTTTGGTTTGGTTTGGTTTGGTTTGGTTTGGSTTGGSTTGGTTTGGTTTGGTTTGGTTTGGTTTGGTTTGGTTTGTAQWNTETFEQASAPKLDIVWVIDNSGSMANEQASLGTNFSAFIGDFVDKGVDFKMAITTTDTASSSNAGVAVSGSMTKLTSAKAASNRNTFLSDFNQLVRVGTRGSGNERGLQASKRFVERYETSWMRDEAYLIVVYLSDEEDQSTGTAASFLSALQATKDNAGYVKAFSIVGMTGCPNQSGYTCGYQRYQHMADNSGGSTTDITGNFSNILTGIGNEVADLLDSFPLGQDPLSGTVSVKVNGVDVASGWQVIGRQVKFNAGSEPAAGSAVEIRYQY